MGSYWFFKTNNKRQVMYFIELILYVAFSILGFFANIIIMIGKLFSFSVSMTTIILGGTIKIGGEGLTTFQKIDRFLGKFDPILYKILGLQPKEKLATVKVEKENSKTIPKNYH